MVVGRWKTGWLKPLSLMIFLSNAVAFDWEKETQTVHACLNSDAAFDWRYDPAMTEITLIQWQFDRTGDAVIAHYLSPQDRIVIHHPDMYKGRVSPLGGANAGMLLKNVNTDDEGTYSVTLYGIAGGDGLADLQVHQNDDLKVTTEVDGETLTGISTEKYQGESVQFRVVTALGIPAHSINIHPQGTENDRVIHCTEATTCTHKVNITERTDAQFSVRFVVNYGFCEIQDYTITVQIQATTAAPTTEGMVVPGPQSTTALIVAVIVLVVLLVAVAGMLIACFAIRRKKIHNVKLVDAEEAYIAPSLSCCPITLEIFVSAIDHKRRLLEKYYQGRLRDIERRSQSLRVTIEDAGEQEREDGFLIRIERKEYLCTNTQKEMEKVERALNRLLSEIVQRRTSINQDILTENGRRFLKRKEDEHKVICAAEPVQVPEPDAAVAMPPDPVVKDVFQLGSLMFEVVRGDITVQRVDAIVCAVDVNLQPQGVVAGIILDKAGNAVSEECTQLAGNFKKVAVSDAGDLDCGKILFLDTSSPHTWKERVSATLECARDNDLSSLAMPAFGTAAGANNREHTADMSAWIYEAVKQFSESNQGTVQNVSVVILEEELRQTFVVGVTDHKAQGFAMNNLRLVVERGDLTASTCDIIVNGTNSQFIIHGAVSKAIAKEGGFAIQDECEEWLETYGDLQTVAYTGKGRLAGCQGIIHLNTQNDARDWPKRIYDVLKLADTKQCASVAFPAFGTGKIAQISAARIAPWMYQGVRRFAEECPMSSVTAVVILAYDETAKSEFVTHIKTEHLGLPRLAEPRDEDGVDGVVLQDAPQEPTVDVTVYTLEPEVIDDVIRDIQSFPDDAPQVNHAVGPGRADAESGGGHPEPAEADRLLGQGLWSYEDAGDWQPFSPAVNGPLEAAYQRGDTQYEWTDEGVGTFTINFSTMERSDTTGAKVNVQRE